MGQKGGKQKLLGKLDMYEEGGGGCVICNGMARWTVLCCNTVQRLCECHYYMLKGYLQALKERESISDRELQDIVYNFIKGKGTYQPPKKKFKCIECGISYVKKHMEMCKSCSIKTTKSQAEKDKEMLEKEAFYA